jgi:hypothetical protein
MARRRLGLPPLFQRRNMLAFAKKAFWLGMLVLHLGAIRSAALTVFASVGVAPRPDSGLRLFALSIAATFFALKFADVPWLRLKRSWRSAVASLVVVALLHVNAVQRLADGERMSSPTPLSAVLFVAVLVDVGAVRRRSLHLWKAVVRASTDRAQRRGRRSYPCNTAWPEAAVPPHSWLARGLLTPRPPPLA